MTTYRIYHNTDPIATVQAPGPGEASKSIDAVKFFRDGIRAKLLIEFMVIIQGTYPIPELHVYYDDEEGVAQKHTLLSDTPAAGLIAFTQARSDAIIEGLRRDTEHYEL